MAIASENKTIVGVFNSVQDAQEAVRDLEMEGISRSDISIVANKNAAGYETMDKSDKASDVVADAGIGAAIGGVGGLLLAAAGAVTVPVIGPILAAGPIAAALTGAGIGAAAGGLVGALTESGIPEDEARYYAEGVRRGDVLLTVKSDSGRADRVCDILDRHNAIDVDDRVSNWKNRGWSGYREDVQPLTAEELRREREYYRGAAGTDYATGYSTGTTDYPGATTRDTGSVVDFDKDGRNDIAEGAEKAGRKMKEWGQEAKDAARTAGHKIAEAGRDVKDTVAGAGHKVAEEGRELRDEARDRERAARDYENEAEAARRRRSRVYDHIKY